MVPRAASAPGPPPIATRWALLAAGLMLSACASTPGDGRDKSLRENTVEKRIRERELSTQESAEKYGELDTDDKVMRSVFKGAPISF